MTDVGAVLRKIEVEARRRRLPIMGPEKGMVLSVIVD
jgi:hypothetical protein